MSEELLKLVVGRSVDLTPRVRLYELAAPEGGPLPPFRAGAHIDLRFREEQTQSFALTNDPRDNSRYCIAIEWKEDDAERTGWLRDHLVPGFEVMASQPINDFVLDESGDRYILIADGIGIAPLVSMCRRLLTLEKQFSLYFIAPSLADAPFADRLERLLGERFIMVCGESASGPTKDWLSVLAEPQQGVQVYVSGSNELVATVRAAMAHWPPGCLHSARSEARVLQLENDRPDLTAAKPFEIELAHDGRVLTVPADQTILETLEAAGVAVQAVCRQGWCGTCRTGLLSGAADHRDEVLDDDEKADNTAIQICVSRALDGERLVLDL